jgi:xylulokinase
MGIDLGTSACKTIIFSLEGKKISESLMEYPVYHPKPRWAEQKPSDWWNAAVKTIKKSLKKAQIKSNEIVGLSVDSQREAVVPIDKKGEELYNSIIWLDNRTGEQAEKIKKLINVKKVLQITGVKIDPIFSASKILWLKENVPNIFRKTEYFLCAKDYLIYKLTGKYVTDYSMASRTLLFDIRKKEWSEEITSTIGLPIEKLPFIKESWAIVGEVSSKASKETFLPKGLPVVNGGGDRPCECLGAGVTQEGKVNIGTGTGSAVEIPLTKPVIDILGRINCCCHVVPDTWEYEALITTTGASLRWFRDTLGTEEKNIAKKSNKDPYDILTKEARGINPGSDGLFFYPYLTGAFSPIFNEKARGVYFGINLSHTKGHFIRSILEGVSFQYIGTFEMLKDLNLNIQDITMVGGETRSNLWNQIKADITGNKIFIPEVNDAAALGAALLAGIGTKQYTSVQKAIKEAVRIKKIYTSNHKIHNLYSSIYRDYKKVYSSIEKAYRIY